MIESVIMVGWFLIGAATVDKVIIPAAKDANTTYVQPTIEYTKDKVGEGVDYVKEKLN